MWDCLLVGVASLCLFALWCNLTNRGRRWWRDLGKSSMEDDQEWEELLEKNRKESGVGCSREDAVSRRRRKQNAPKAKGAPQLTQDITYTSGKSPIEDAYRLLGCCQGDSLSEIKSRYREAAKRYHPDSVGRNGATPEASRWASEKMKQINSAWNDILHHHPIEA